MPNYIVDSMELNLFYLRIMKEHAMFLQMGFTPKNKDMANEAECFKRQFNELLKHTIDVSKGYISIAVMTSGELFTQFTEEAERQTEFYTGMPIDIQLTKQEYDLGGCAVPTISQEPVADEINRKALVLVQEYQLYQKRVLESMLSCRIFTNNFPLTIDHFIRETENYIDMLKALMSHILEFSPREFALEQVFWSTILEEHAAFTASLFDPTERELRKESRMLEHQFEILHHQAQEASKKLNMLLQVTFGSKEATEAIIKFDTQGTKGILSCNIRSIMIPLLVDHGLREAHRYMRILNETMSVWR